MGVYQTLRPRGPLDRPNEIDGAALETLFLEELIAYNAYLDLGYTIFIGRPRLGVRSISFCMEKRGSKHLR